MTERPNIARRTFLGAALGAGVASAALASGGTQSVKKQPDPKSIPDYAQWRLSEAEWKKRLSPEAFAVLRKEATERPWSSPLNDEKRKGIFACAGCGYDLFSSDKKFDSGTGWPSFSDHLPNALGTKTDWKLVVPRTEYHCARCDGHQGHVFDDGPRPTGLRYCNNGVALIFRPA